MEDAKRADTGSSKTFVKELTRQAREYLILGLVSKTGTNLSSVVDLLCGQKFKQILIAPANPCPLDWAERRDLRTIQRYIREQWRPFVEVSVNAVILSFVLEVEHERWEGASFSLGLPGLEGTVNLYESMKNILSEHREGVTEHAEKRLRELDSALYPFYDNEARGGRKLLDFVKREVTEAVGPNVSVETVAAGSQAAVRKLESGEYDEYLSLVYFFGVLPTLAEFLRDELGDDKFSLVFQRVANNLRAYGSALSEGGGGAGKVLFSIPRRINACCRALRHYREADPQRKDNDPSTNPAYIVVNSFKNIFETYYFKRRYSSFYLMAVSTESSDGIRRSMRTGGDEEGYVGLGENTSLMKRVFRKYFEVRERVGRTPAAAETRLPRRRHDYCKEVETNDALRAKCYHGSIASFILQDVTPCIEGADVFVTRDLSEPIVSSDEGLVRSIARFIVLAMHPGLLKPTKVERCMQQAMSAKLNSGCLSRQVGAVVTDSDFNILSIGWNDVPCGVESCARRNLLDVISKYDRDAYSEFELNDPEFREYIELVDRQIRSRNLINDVLRGLPASYCFKDIYQDIIHTRDQIHTRSLHAEERALAACGNERANGGFLFTTSSPCELCAKKAKEAGIARIYYIERYPGISHDHIIDDGPYETRAEYQFFVGAVGEAYMRLYSPVIPYKDELDALGVSPEALHAAEVAE